MNSQTLSLVVSDSLENSSAVCSTPPRFACFGTFHVDLQKEELFRDGTRVKVQGKVYQALLALLEKPGEVVTRESLRMRLWPSDTHVNYDANVNTTVNKLRQILGDSPEEPIFVDTIPRKGYSFVGKVEYVDQVAAKNSAPAEDEAPSGVLEALLPFLHSRRARIWVAAGVVALILAGALFGAALTLFAHRAV
jgi:DNA-binding winged helix-turn-helix (wHTH) protein